MKYRFRRGRGLARNDRRFRLRRRGGRRFRRGLGSWRRFFGGGRVLGHFRQKTEFGARLFRKRDDVSRGEKCLADLLAVQEGSVGAFVHQLEPVSLADDAGVAARHGNHVAGKADAAVGSPADDDEGFREFLNLAFQRALNVNKLNGDAGWIRHGRFHGKGGIAPGKGAFFERLRSLGQRPDDQDAGMPKRCQARRKNAPFCLIFIRVFIRLFLLEIEKRQFGAGIMVATSSRVKQFDA
jgi:hypothetical protein